jgi:alkanesulfonate monooxygenase SsuD/methylene tetrahydromethanopterin reductase-like flavin-dependent oxidoreductase (luciferase family)
MLGAAGRERGWARPTRSTFDAEIAGGSLYVGSPETVATKLAAAIRLLGLSRFDLAYAVGRVPHEQRMATIELYGREVIPRVRALLEDPPVQPVPSDQDWRLHASIS